MTQAQDLIRYLIDESPRLHYDTSNALCQGIEGRCNPGCSGFADCSGIISDALAHIGVPQPSRCMWSGSQFQWCRDHGTQMAVADAVQRPGSLIFLGPSGIEHIAVVVGGGMQVAAHGHHSTPQVGVAPISDSNWSCAGWWPGLHDDTWPPILPPTEKVHPMYDPPLASGLGLAAVWQDSGGRVLAAVTPNGDVYAWAVPFRPWPTKAKDFAGRRAARISQANLMAKYHGLPSNRYAITDTAGETYCP